MESRDPPPPIDDYLSQPTAVELEIARLYPPYSPLTIFDIGACEGEDSIRYARRFPRSRVFTFEPLPANQELVRKNFRRYDADRCELIPIALSDRPGNAIFHVSSGRPREKFAGENWNYGNKSSSLLPPATSEPMYGWIEFKQEITVQTETLDRFCENRKIDTIDFVHLDVQGAEMLVLSGATRMLPRTACIWLEVSDQPLYAGQSLRDEIESFMKRQGFALGFEERREIEGDQFYMNTRHPSAMTYLARNRMRALWRTTRRLAGRFKRALAGGAQRET